MKLLTISLAYLFLIPLCMAENERVADLILVAGQSNAVGFDAKTEDLPENAVDKDVLFWWKCGDPPADKFDSSSNQQWTFLQAQPKGSPKMVKGQRQYGNFQYAQGGFGPEMGMARLLRKMQPERDLAFVKVAYSGTAISEWERNETPDQTCYEALVMETKMAIEKANAMGIKLNVRALVWVQGESDANEKGVKVYEDKLGRMIENLKEDLEAPDLVALVGVNTRFGGGKNSFMHGIIKAQMKLAEGSKAIVYVDSAGCAVANNAHFDSAGTLELGERFAKQLIMSEKYLAEK